MTNSKPKAVLHWNQQQIDRDLKRFNILYIFPVVSHNIEKLRKHFTTIDYISKLAFLKYLEGIYDIQNIDSFYKLFKYRFTFILTPISVITSVFNILTHRVLKFDKDIAKFASIYFNIAIDKESDTDYNIYVNH